MNYLLFNKKNKLLSEIELDIEAGKFWNVEVKDKPFVSPFTKPTIEVNNLPIRKRCDYFREVSSSNWQDVIGYRIVRLGQKTKNVTWERVKSEIQNDFGISELDPMYPEYQKLAVEPYLDLIDLWIKNEYSIEF